MQKENVIKGLKYIPVAIILLIMILLYRGNEKPNILDDNTTDTVFPSLFENKESISTKKLLGKRYVVQFFATWCGYCMDEYDAFLNMERKIPMYGILWGDDPENGKSLVKEKTSPFLNIGVDQYGMISKKFGISVIPQTFVIDEKGEIIFHRIGAFDPRHLLKFFN